MQKLIVSKCCASPLLSRGSSESTGWAVCAECKNPADQMVYPFTTVKAMETWLKKRKAFRGMAYTASPKITPWRSGKEIFPSAAKPNLTTKPMCIGSSLGAFLVGCIIGILIFWILV